jgi:hypothetical protein
MQRCSLAVSAFSRWSSATSASAKTCEAHMLFDYVLGGTVSLLILAYLTYALARPDKF